MTHEERVKIIEKGVSYPEGFWADLGCGNGAFTLALAELLQAPAEIYAIDESKKALNELRSSFKMRFPNLTAHFLGQVLPIS
jgi:ubiquinone/menaquinone biosynthesis C-methylase UbiE